jgi:cytoskeleton protein RodZ
MARSTRVRERYLEAIEGDSLGELPAPVFTRGFVRAYCQVLGESPDEPLRLYAEQAGLPATSEEKRELPRLAERESRGREPVLVSLVLLLVLGVALFAVTFALQGRSKSGVSPTERPSARVAAPAVRPSAPAPAQAPPVATPPLALTPAPAPPKAAVTPPNSTAPVLPAVAGATTYRLVARVKERTWVRVRSDDGRVTEETMSPGDVREWVSNRRFVLTIGNAGGLALELNGQALPPLGPSGVVIPELVIPPDRQ